MDASRPPGSSTSGHLGMHENQLPLGVLFFVGILRQPKNIHSHFRSWKLGFFFPRCVVWVRKADIFFHDLLHFNSGVPVRHLTKNHHPTQITLILLPGRVCLWIVGKAWVCKVDAFLFKTHDQNCSRIHESLAVCERATAATVNVLQPL